MSPRDVYISNMEARLMGWGDELAWLKSQAAFLATHGSAEFQKRIDFEEAKHQVVYRKFEGLKNSSHDHWGTLAAGVDGEWEALTT